jgi:hypothetical protein
MAVSLPSRFKDGVELALQRLENRIGKAGCGNAARIRRAAI